MLHLWNVEEAKEVVTNNKVELIKIYTKEDLEFIGCHLIGGDLHAFKQSSSATEIADQIRKSPYIIDGHNESNKFDLSTGKYVLYVLANGSIGFGIIGTIHCINSLLVCDDELVLSRLSISGTVMNRVDNIKALEDKVNLMNTEITSDGLKVEKIIYFA